MLKESPGQATPIRLCVLAGESIGPLNKINKP
jgi:hypothetical protein